VKCVAYRGLVEKLSSAGVGRHFGLVIVSKSRCIETDDIRPVGPGVHDLPMGANIPISVSFCGK